jgi:Fe-S cluster biogenesis protein NfuA
MTIVHLENPAVRKLEEAFDWDVRPGLSAHMGSIKVHDVSEDSVDLEFEGSCMSCYFRISCAVNLVAPTVVQTLGEHVEVKIRGTRKLPKR